MNNPGQSELEIRTADYGAGPGETPEQNRTALNAAVCEARKHGGVVICAPGEYAGQMPLDVPWDVEIEGRDGTVTEESS